MEQRQQNGAGFDLFADSSTSNPHYHAYDPSFLNGPDSQSFHEAAWAVNAGSNPNPNQSRVGQPAWLPNANHYPAAAAASQQYARTLSHSPASFNQTAYSGFDSPQNFQQQYRQPQYDPALLHTAPVGQPYGNDNNNNNNNNNNNHHHHPAASNNLGYGNQLQTSGTISPHALQQQARSSSVVGNAYNAFNRNAYGPTILSGQPTAPNVSQRALIQAIPPGDGAGYFSTIGLDHLARATNSERLGPFAHVGKQAHEWPVNKPTSLPIHAPRKSKNELRRLAGNDPTLLAKIGRRAIKQVVAPGVKGPNSPPETIKYEGETSSSDESSDDDSSYTSEEDLEGSPLPSKRPDTPKEAVEYDTIKALWRSKRRPVDRDTIKEALTAFWDVVKVIRDRWKADASAVTEAEEKKRMGELPLLKSRVKDQRDMIEAAFKAALKHGHRSIVEILGSNTPLVYLIYQFLLDRHKAKDFNGPLTRALLEVTSLFTTVDEAALEKTHLDKVLKRYVKQGDAKTQYYAKKVLQNAAAASKQNAESATKPGPSPAKTGSAASPVPVKKEPEPVAGIKRSASNAGEGGMQKKLATGLTKPNGTSAMSRLMAPAKKSTSSADAAKPSTATTTPATKTKQVTAKPSSFFSTLSAAKKPGTSIKAGTPAQAAGPKMAAERKPSTAPATAAAPKSSFSFAETMANLNKPKQEKPPSVKPVDKEVPSETPDQKAKRLRREARGNLKVHFKLGDDLCEIRYFSHDPEEEMGHNDSQMRDMADAGGEGRALKLHQDMMDIDEDDEPEAEQQLVEFKEPSQIDFSDVDPEERSKNYSRFGGGKLEPDSAERAVRDQYEANTLMVFYTDESEIPPNPKEPDQPYNGEPGQPTKSFGRPEQKSFDRVQRRKAMLPQHQQQAPSAAPSPFDLSKYLPNQPQQVSAPAVPPPPPATGLPQGLDLNALLANITAQQQQPQPPQPAPSAFNFGSLPPPPMVTSAAPPPPPMNGLPQPDISAILATLQGGQFGGATGAPNMSALAPPMQQLEPDGGADGGLGGGKNSKEKKRWRDQNPDTNRFFKTKTCRYWLSGKCQKGENCTYLHDRSGMDDE
ncbi:zinc- finger protein [Teratosphaeria destructans]|uniref:Zinc- finger protein n=1 Tax=Teratosphaeria destructans TaxID=418781 RepID=A0A9W7SWL3_9PEZI|nr:zinc- finger protein [Teratosphaeria destructans]